MTTAVVAHRCLDRIGHNGQVVSQELFDGLASQLGSRLERLVQIGHISVVVFAMMNLHRGLVNVRLKSVVSVRESGK